MEIDLRIEAIPLVGGDPAVDVVRIRLGADATARQRVACEQVWRSYPDARFVSYRRGDARFTHDDYEISASLVWDTQSSSREPKAALISDCQPQLF